MNGPQPDPDPTRTAALSSIAPVTPTNPETVAPVPAAEPAEPAAAPAGQFGEYVLVGELGRGGMGAVYRAEDPRLKREVALKVMLPQFAANEQAKARFVREARAQAKVEHDHVAAILHIGDHQGLPYIVMPLLKGVTLHAALRANPRPPLAEVIRIGREMAEGLAAAHEKGLVHRDIKPANVWLEGKKLRVKILDFGLARVADGDAVDATDGPVTREGAVVGTPAYMSPEQGRGLPVDGRTDLWSLGVVLYQMTTGELPFRGANTLAILTALAIDHPPPPIARNPAVPQHLSDFVVRLLAKDPAYRPQSAEAAAEELRAIELGLANAVRVVPLDAPPPIVLHPEGHDPFADLGATEALTAAPAAPPVDDDVPVATPARPPRRGGFPVWALVGGVLLAVAGVVGFVATQMGRKPEPEVAKEEPSPPAARPKTVQQQTQAGDRPNRVAVEDLHTLARVSLRVNGTVVQIPAGEPLPPDPLELVGVRKYNDGVALPPDFTARCLKALAGQKSVEFVEDAILYARWTEREFAELAKLPARDSLTNFTAALELTPKTVELLKQFPRLKQVSGLDASGADDATLAAFAAAGKSPAGTGLHALGLGQSGKVTAKGWAAVAALPLVELMLTRPKGLDREACALIAKMPDLISLSVTEGELDDDALVALAAAPRLRDLHLVDTKLPPGGTRHLAAFPKLRLLHLTRCPLTDDDVPHLAAVKRLRGLSFVQTKLDRADAAEALNAALPRCAVTTSAKTYEPTDAHFREASRLVQQPNRKVTVKLADGTRVEAVKPDDLPDAAFTLAGVDLSGGTPEEVKRLATTPTLERFVDAGGAITPESLRALLPSKDTLTLFYSASEMTDDDLKVVGQFARLKSVHATGPKVTDVGAGHLAGLKELSSVALPGSAITAAGVRRLAALPALAELVAFDSALGDDAVEALAALAGLRKLDVARTRVTAAGHGRLRRALPDCKTEWEEPERWVAKYLLGPPALGVTVRTAAGKEVDVPRPEDLPAEPFTLVRVSRGPGATRLTDEKLRRLEATPTLVGIDAPGAPITAAGLRSLRASRDTLRDLYLNGVVVTDEMCAELAELTALVGLNFEREGQAVTDAGLAHLARLPNLEALWVGGSQVTDAGLKALAAMPRLRSLSLNGTAVSDAAVETLAQIPALGELILTDTRVTAAGVKRLQDALPKCRISWDDPGRAIPKAFLSRAGFEFTLRLPSGATVKAGKPEDLPLGPFTVTGIVNGSAVPITNADLLRLSALPGLENLTLGEHRLTDAGLAPLSAWKGTLQLLSLRGSGTVTDAGMAVVAGLGRVGVLDLSGRGITDAGVERLAGMGSVYQLSLSKTGVTDAGLRHVARFPSVNTLWLNDTAVSDAGVDTLVTMKGLKTLGLWETRVTDAGFKRLKDALPGCEVNWAPPDRVAAAPLLERAGFELELRLPDGRQVLARKPADLPAGPFTLVTVANSNGAVVLGDADLVRLSRLAGLTGLYAQGTQVTDAGLRPLLHLKGTLVGLNLSHAPIGDEGAAVVGQLTNLRNVSLGATKVTDAGLARLAGLTKVTDLGLNALPLTDAGLGHLAGMADLRSLNVENTAVTDAAVETLAGFKALAGVHLTGTRVTAAGVKKLRDALPNCKVVWEPAKAP